MKTILLLVLLFPIFFMLPCYAVDDFGAHDAGDLPPAGQKLMALAEMFIDKIAPALLGVLVLVNFVKFAIEPEQAVRKIKYTITLVLFFSTIREIASWLFLI